VGWNIQPPKPLGLQKSPPLTVAIVCTEDTPKACLKKPLFGPLGSGATVICMAGQAMVIVFAELVWLKPTVRKANESKPKTKQDDIFFKCVSFDWMAWKSTPITNDSIGGLACKP
jgi:hypothetical protein